MKKRRNSAARRAEQAVERAYKTIEEAGWKVYATLVMRTAGGGEAPVVTGRFVAVKKRHEHEDDSVTKLFESDYTIEGLAALVARREREETR